MDHEAEPLTAPRTSRLEKKRKKEKKKKKPRTAELLCGKAVNMSLPHYSALALVTVVDLAAHNPGQGLEMGDIHFHIVRYKRRLLKYQLSSRKITLAINTDYLSH